jgi:hypothetical protein
MPVRGGGDRYRRADGRPFSSCPVQRPTSRWPAFPPFKFSPLPSHAAQPPLPLTPAETLSSDFSSKNKIQKNKIKPAPKSFQSFLSISLLLRIPRRRRPERRERERERVGLESRCSGCGIINAAAAPPPAFVWSASLRGSCDRKASPRRLGWIDRPADPSPPPPPSPAGALHGSLRCALSTGIGWAFLESNPEPPPPPCAVCRSASGRWRRGRLMRTGGRRRGESPRQASEVGAGGGRPGLISSWVVCCVASTWFLIS